MKQLFFQNGAPDIREEPWPVPKDSDVLIKVRAAHVYQPDEAILKLFAVDHEFLAGGFVVGSVVQMGALSEAEAELALEDMVVGIVPFASSSTCWAEFCLVPRWSCIKLTQTCDARRLVAALPGAIMAYTLFDSRTQLQAGDRVLLSDGASCQGHMIAQLACQQGAKVVSLVQTSNDSIYLKSATHLAAVYDKTTDLADIVKKETGGLGFNMVIDCHTSTAEDVEESELVVSRVNALTTRGVWAPNRSIQLSEAVSHSLMLKGGCVSWYSLPAWSQGSANQGHLMHMMAAVVDQVAQGKLKPHIGGTLTLDELKDFFEDDQHYLGSVVITFR
eukprot:m.27092 g.27092  ORF g.27092 m.27092 type:complete len:332 (+) comp11750_c0_seq2:40-1035(+)